MKTTAKALPALLLVLLTLTFMLMGPSTPAKGTVKTTHNIAVPNPLLNAKAGETTSSSPLQVTEHCDMNMAEPLPVTVYRDPPEKFPTKSDLRLIGRIAEGILKLMAYRTPGNGIAWAECGEWYETKQERQAAAAEWAFHIVRVSNRFNLNTWGLAGLVFHESSDRCAIGPHPRNWAYRKWAPWGGKFLNRSKRGISHRKEDILKMMSTEAAKRRWKRTGIDCGPGQILSRYYPNQLSELMSLDPGLDIVGERLVSNSKMYRTPRPWASWRGKMLSWYDRRVTRVARIMGARIDEIGRPIPERQSRKTI